MEQLRRFTASLLIAWLVSSPRVLALETGGDGVLFVLPDPASHWSLLGRDNNLLCVLPCTYRVPQASEYRLRLDVANPLVLTLPSDLRATQGMVMHVRPVAGISRASKLTMETVGFVMSGVFAVLEVLVVLDHFTTSRAAPCLGNPKLPTGGCEGATVAEGVDWSAGVGSISALFLSLGVVGAVLPETHLDIHAVEVR